MSDSGVREGQIERRGDGVNEPGINFSTKELFLEIKHGQDRLNEQMYNLQLNGSNKAQEASKDVARLEERVRLLENTTASQVTITRLGIMVAIAILSSVGTWVALILRLR